jgi:phosphatidylglycerol:prolipoprotein diacylglycerol transferase
MVFPNGGPEPRHPSQLYQALLEGVILFGALWILRRRVAPAYGPGFLSGAFLVGYSIARIIGELFRQPDWFLGFLPGGTTMGQLLSLPMAAFGIYLIWRSARIKQPA